MTVLDILRIKHPTLKRRAWIALLLVNAGIIFWFWWHGNGSLIGSDAGQTLIAFGRLFGLILVQMVLLQFFLWSRTPWLEGLFGLDKLAQLHHRVGRWVLVPLIAHPTLIILGYSQINDSNILQQITSFLSTPATQGAAIAFTLFILVILIAIGIINLPLKFEAWYFTHLVVYVALAFSIRHQFVLGEDIAGNPPLRAYWLWMYIIVLGLFVLFRHIRPWLLFARHRFTVEKVVQETYDVNSIYITGRNMKKFRPQPGQPGSEFSGGGPSRKYFTPENLLPGQFMIFRFLDKKRWWQAHPFSLSMVPDGQRIRITPKEVGDFTQEIKHVNPGTKVLIEGPFGIFTERFSSADKILMIAGGIGITPIRSLTEHMLSRGKDVILLYSNRTEKDIVFKSELESLVVSCKSLVVHHVLSNEQGNIDEQKIRHLVPDFLGREVFLCGPPAMMDAIVSIFTTLDMPKDKIHFEKFEL